MKMQLSSNSNNNSRNISSSHSSNCSNNNCDSNSRMCLNKLMIKFSTNNSYHKINNSNSNLKKLVQALGDGLNKIAVPDNKKYFSDSVFFGNINVCRLAKPPGPDFKNKVKELEGTYIGEVLASQVHLLACNAFCNPDTRKFIGAYQLAQA